MNPLESYSTEQLEAELKRRNIIAREDAKCKSIDELTRLFGVSASQVRVYTHDDYGDDELRFSFFLVKRGKERDFYYDWYNHNKDKPVAGWPARLDGYGEWENLAFRFIPQGFAEACENSYEFHGTLEEAVAALHKMGITDIREMEQ